MNPLKQALFALTIGLAVVASPVSPPVSAQPASRFDAIDEFVERERDASNIPGIAIAVVENGEIVHARGFGRDGRGNDVSADTPFPIGSLTKSFTALAVEQLIAAGKVALDAPVQRYLPDFALADSGAAGKITVRHLLNQTSGFSRADGGRYVAEEGTKALDEVFSSLREVKLNREVGVTYEYSNLNYVVLGKLVEAVGGTDWQAYIEEHIFAPAGMTNSYATFDDARAAGMTKVHQYWFGLPKDGELEYLPGVAPTGYLAASASDMGRYLSLYLRQGQGTDGTVLTAEGVERMLTGNTNNTGRPLMSHAFEFQYGEGWFVGSFGAADDARWHLGNLSSFTAWMVLLPETDQGVVVLMNAGSAMELFGGSSTLSRIPLGTVNLLRGEPAPRGVTIVRWYVYFDAIVVFVVLAQAFALYRLVRRLRAPTPAPSKAKAKALFVAPFLWEFPGAAALLFAYPGVMGGSWGNALDHAPDLTIVVVVVGGTWLLTGVTRAAVLARQRGRDPTGETPEAAPTRSPAPLAR